MPKMVSMRDRLMAVADVNGDGLDACTAPPRIRRANCCVQRANGLFASSNEAAFAQDRISEDVGAVFFDAIELGISTVRVERRQRVLQMAPRPFCRIDSTSTMGAGCSEDHRTPPARRGPVARAWSRPIMIVWRRRSLHRGRVVPGRYGIDPRSHASSNVAAAGSRCHGEAGARPGKHRHGHRPLWTDVTGDGRVDLLVVGE